MNTSKFISRLISPFRGLGGLLIAFIISSETTGAQVPVREEPHHKVVLENEYIRLIDVYISPRDTTQYHIHNTPSVIVHLSTSMIGSQLMGGAQSFPAQVIPGDLRYAAYDEKPITHRVWNHDSTTTFHVMDIEVVRNKNYTDSCLFLAQAGTDLVLNEKVVRVYKINIEAGKQFNFPSGNCAHLLIGINGIVHLAEYATNQKSNNRLKAGEYIFFPAHNKIQVNNDDNENASCVLLELK